MSQIVNVTGVTQVTNVQIEAAIQKLFFSITGVATLAQMQAVKIEVRKVGQESGTDQLIFQGFLEDYIEMNAQMENGTFTVAANELLGNVVIARQNSMYVGQGDNLTLFITGLIATMVVNVYGLETKAVGRSYAKFMPQNIPGIAPIRRKVTLEDVLYIPNDGTVDVVELMYKGRTVTYQQAELQAICRDLRSVISPNYGGAVFVGFVNWLGISLKDVMEVQVTPNAANVNTTFYMVDEVVVIEDAAGKVMKLNSAASIVSGAKGDYSAVRNPIPLKAENKR